MRLHVQGEDVPDDCGDRRTVRVRREEREDLPLDPQEPEEVQGASDQAFRQGEEGLHGEVGQRVHILGELANGGRYFSRNWPKYSTREAEQLASRKIT